MRELALRVRDLIVASDQYRHAVAAALKIGIPEVVTLGHLYHLGQLTPTAIAEQLGMTTASVTGLLDRLAGYGYVVRSPNPHDRRSILVSLTEHGMRISRASFDAFAGDIESAVSGTEDTPGLCLFLQAAAAALRRGSADQDRLAELFSTALEAKPGAVAPESDQRENSAT